MPRTRKAPSISHQMSNFGGFEANAVRHGQGQSPPQVTSEEHEQALGNSVQENLTRLMQDCE